MSVTLVAVVSTQVLDKHRHYPSSPEVRDTDKKQINTYDVSALVVFVPQTKLKYVK